jgi:hypothetical protein
VNVRDDDGNAPLHVAASGGLRECVTTLLAVSTLARAIIVTLLGGSSSCVG